MSFDKLHALGAQSVAGRVFLNHVEVGRWADGQFLIYPEGEEAIAAAEAPAAEEVPAEQPKPRRAARAKAEAPAEQPTTVPPADDLPDLDSLLPQ
jgi:hypothetical protein